MVREAGTDDFVALRDLEQAASLAALGHIFAPERHPYPGDEVLARWRIVLDDPAMTVLVEDDSGSLVGLAAYDDSWLHHLAVHPDQWGRGLGAKLANAALARMAARGASAAHLWVLADNHRARDFYERGGWTLAEQDRRAEYPPYPRVVSYTRGLSDLRRGDPAVWKAPRVGTM